jgi:hypothetical protein
MRGYLQGWTRRGLSGGPGVQCELRRIRLVQLRSASVVLLALVIGCGAKSRLNQIRIDDGTPDQDSGAPSCVDDCPPSDLCAGKSCDDLDECTADACDAASGDCVFSPVTYDRDGDGYRGPRPGYPKNSPSACGDDCNDQSSLAHPGGVELCDGVDNDCSGVVDDGSSYVASAMQDVRISHADHLNAGRGALASNEGVFAATWTGEGPNDDARSYVSLLSPGSATTVAETKIGSPLGSGPGPIVWTGSLFGTAGRGVVKNGPAVYFSLVDAHGEELLSRTVASSVGIGPSLAWNGAEFLVAWDDYTSPFDSTILGQRIDIDGELVGDSITLTTPGDYALGPRLAIGTTTVAIAFQELDVHTRVGIQIHAHDFQSPGGVIWLSEDDALEPRIAFNTDRYVVVYGTESVVPGDAIWGAAVDENGQVLVAEKKLTSGGSFARSPYLLPLGDRLLLIWVDDYDGNYEIYSQILSPDLEVTEPRQRITFDAGNTLAPVAAFGKDGEVGVLFEDDRTGSWQVYFNRLVCVPGP